MAVKNFLKRFFHRDVSKIPAFDELTLLTLKRYYLNVNKINLKNKEDDYNEDFPLSDNVRLLKIDEISFDIREPLSISF